MRKRNYTRADRSSRTRRRKKLLIAVSVFVGVYLIGSFVLGEMGLVKYYRMKAQYNDLNRDIAELKQGNQLLLREVHSLKTDAAYIERVARDKLGLARPGEIVYYYGDAEKTVSRMPADL